jgi:hypothetical protein
VTISAVNAKKLEIFGYLHNFYEQSFFIWSLFPGCDGFCLYKKATRRWLEKVDFEWSYKFIPEFVPAS